MDIGDGPVKASFEASSRSNEPEEPSGETRALRLFVKPKIPPAVRTSGRWCFFFLHILYFHPKIWGRFPFLTHIFQMSDVC